MQSMIKKILKSIIPESFFVTLLNGIKIYNLFRDFLYDLFRYKKYSVTQYLKNQTQMEGKIIAHYHVIEKGLSYENIRLGFGQSIVVNLIKLLKEYSEKKYDLSNKQYNIAVSVIAKYIELHDDNNYDISQIKEKFKTIKRTNLQIEGGTLELSRENIFNECRGDFKKLVFSRHSVRDFTTENVEISLIKEAITLAQRSPSVCNRQTSRVYVVSDSEKIKKHLSYQNGNRGFGHKINKLLIVTSDLRYFEGGYERNQNFVDAGIFSMSLLYAIHYVGLGAITLNWCVEKEKDEEYRKFAKINSSENIILMIGIGHIPESITVPFSARRDVEEIITYI